MTEYIAYRWLFPPRPEYKISEASIGKYDSGQYIAQVKYNGSCAMLFLPGDGTFILKNRHNDSYFTNTKDLGFAQLQTKGTYTVFCAEYLNKNKKGEHGEPFNHKLILWDVLVYDGKYLLGSTFEERLDMLENLYPCQRGVVGKGRFEMYDHLCNTPFENIYRAPSYVNRFASLYHEAIKTDAYEGLVLKRKDAKLTPGYAKMNNETYQLKVRKSTKNYSF